MYKFIITCYYWPASNGQLKLRTQRFIKNRRSQESSFDYSQVATFASVDTPLSSLERRRSPRLKISCDAELIANLAILDNDAVAPIDSLVFLGRTTNLSAGGLALVLPSTPIDEPYSAKSTRLCLALHLPTGPVELEINPVRCLPLNQEDQATGYLMAAQIISIDERRDEYDNYLRSVAGV